MERGIIFTLVVSKQSDRECANKHTLYDHYSVIKNKCYLFSL